MQKVFVGASDGGREPGSGSFSRRNWTGGRTRTWSGSSMSGQARESVHRSSGDAPLSQPRRREAPLEALGTTGRQGGERLRHAEARTRRGSRRSRKTYVPMSVPRKMKRRCNTMLTSLSHWGGARPDLPPICRMNAHGSWFGGSPTRGLGEICLPGPRAIGQFGQGGLPGRSRNTLQTAYHRILYRLPVSDSWIEGRALVVWGKSIRGLREIYTWIEGNYSWFGGSFIRGLGEITRGLREIPGEKVLQKRGSRVRFRLPLLFYYLLFLFCLNNRDRM